MTVVNLHSAKVDARKPPVAGADFIGVGGPTRMKNMSRRARSFARKLEPARLAGARLFCFDTYGPLDPDPAKNRESQWLFPGGGVKTRDELVARGFEVYPDVLRCLVTDMKGPLQDDALDSARQFARQFADDVL